MSVFFNYIDYIDEYPISSKKNKIVPTFKEFFFAFVFGCIDAMTIYADMLNKGIGVAVNKKESKQYIQMAKKLINKLILFKFLLFIQFLT